MNISLESKRETQIIFFKRSMQTSRNRNCKHRAQIESTCIKQQIYLQEQYQISYTERIHCKIIQSTHSCGQWRQKCHSLALG